jgi:hypothetical protein
LAAQKKHEEAARFKNKMSGTRTELARGLGYELLIKKMLIPEAALLLFSVLGSRIAPVLGSRITARHRSRIAPVLGSRITALLGSRIAPILGSRIAPVL